eukprot:gene8581-14590_t
MAKETLGKHNLIVSETKTIRRKIDKTKESTKGMKALGSLLNVNGEIAHRKRLPEAVKSRRWAYLGHNIRYKGPAKKAMEECERLEKSR